MNSFGERLRFAREMARLTRSALAERIDRTPRTIERWEAGDTSPTAGDAVAVAKALGIEYEWLRSGKGDLPESARAVLPEGARDVLAQLSEAVGADASPTELRLLLYAFADKLDPKDPAERRALNEIKERLLQSRQQ